HLLLELASTSLQTLGQLDEKQNPVSLEQILSLIPDQRYPFHKTLPHLRYAHDCYWRGYRLRLLLTLSAVKHQQYGHQWTLPHLLQALSLLYLLLFCFYAVLCYYSIKHFCLVIHFFKRKFFNKSISARVSIFPS